MKILFWAALALFSVTATHGGNCKIKGPVTASSLKCGDQVYHRNPEVIAAHNACIEGKIGKEICMGYIDCVFEKTGVTKNGETVPEVLLDHAKRDYPGHYAALLKGMDACAKANTKESDLKDPYKHVDCLRQEWEDICKSKTCDFLNNED
ncbi:unnamed protein product [Allacma fusca]|uniref:Uncharacterized protein n=1 Tax=Allacma fusca TaxID=39272 RepID=A0A8J2JWX2_9HEXA|nr:unnamed protein product [Allacma fusca]